MSERASARCCPATPFRSGGGRAWLQPASERSSSDWLPMSGCAPEPVSSGDMLFESGPVSFRCARFASLEGADMTTSSVRTLSRVLFAGLVALAVAAGPASAADGGIKMGAVLPVTGKESKIGTAYKQATEFAVKEVNDAGGIDVGGKKMKIELTLLDDTTDAAKSAQLVEQLMAEQKVDAVIGGYGSHLVEAQSVVPERYGVPYISGGAGARAIFGRSKWVFGTLSPVDVLSQTQMEFLSSLVSAGKLKKPLKIALVTENTEHGKDYTQGVHDYVKAHPGDFSIAVEESFELNAADFKPLLTRVEAAKADLFMADTHLEDFIT